MPIREGKDSNGFYFRYGTTGTKYYYLKGKNGDREKAYKKALRQTQAIKASENRRKKK